MNVYAVACWLVACFGWPLLTTAQTIQISFPVNRAVVQRTAANTAALRITGYYTTAVTRIEAQAEARNGQGVSTGWVTIQNNPQGGVYAGDLTLQGGWYVLRVRGMNGDAQVGEVAVVERVGVGEVFVVAGQSNAQGVHRDAPNAEDDRVNCVNYFYDPAQFPNDPPFPVFSQLTRDVFVAPRGVGSWCWGRLGDLLVRRLGVPVLFLNAAFTGTAVRNWRQSANGQRAESIYVPGTFYEPGQPYVNLRLAMQYYVPMLGVRAVLWHQGEADNFADTDLASYVSDLRPTIERSRGESGRNVPWMVARASYLDARGVDPTVIAAQNQAIQAIPNVFAGPFTDNIQVPRTRPPLFDAEGVHFDNAGLQEVAAAWNASLTDAFFAAAQPSLAQPSPTLSVTCAGNNNLTLTVNGGFPVVNWETGEVGPSITRGAGIYRAKVKDAQGNTFFTPYVRVSPAPGIIVAGPTTFCQGGSVALTASYNNNVTWQPTNSNNPTLVATASGTYSVRYRDVSGCDLSSGGVNVVVNPLPAAPSVTPEKPTTFCQGESTVLRASEAPSYLWSNGERSRSIEPRAGGEYTLTVTDQNGCTSPRSAAVRVVVNPLPNTPTVTPNGPTTFCADRTVTLTASPENAYVWSSGQTSRSITINRSDNYTVRTRNVFNCLSAPSAPINVVVNPLPPTPTISASGRTTICDGERVTLTANSPFRAFWNTGDSTQAITVGRSDNYTVRVRDGNGCLSARSQAVPVDVKPLPSTPSVRQIGTYTLEAEGQLSGSFYRWRINGDTLSTITPIVRANRTGSYTAQAFIIYSPTLTCASAVSTALAFVAETGNQGLSVYPNPSPDKIVLVETLEDIRNATVSVYTLRGQLVYSAPVTLLNERKRLDLVNLAPGTYLVRVQGEGFNVSKRVIIGL